MITPAQMRARLVLAGLPDHPAGEDSNNDDGNSNDIENTAEYLNFSNSPPSLTGLHLNNMFFHSN